VQVLGTPRGSRMQFVYDVGELIDQGQAPPIFMKDGANGGYCLDPKSVRVAEVHGTPAKVRVKYIRTHTCMHTHTHTYIYIYIFFFFFFFFFFYP